MNREQYNAYHRAYYATHREQAKAAREKWVAKNLDRYKVWKREYQREYMRKRRAAQKERKNEK